MNDKLNKYWSEYWLAKAKEHFANGHEILSWAVLFLNIGETT